MLRLETLGQLRLVDETGATVLSAPKELALLVFVASRSPRTSGRDEIQALLWGDRDETKARNSLRQALLKLRRTVGDAFETADRVRLLPGALTFDVRELEDHSANGRFIEALERWGGEFVPGGEALDAAAFRDWLEVERTRIRKTVDHCFAQIVVQAESRGDWPAMVDWSGRWAAAFPLDEPPHLRWVEALRLNRQIGEALARHAEFTQRRLQELGTQPSVQWRRLGARLDEASRTAPVGTEHAGQNTRDGSFSRLVAAWRDVERGETRRVLLSSAGTEHRDLASELVRWLRVTSPRALVLHASATNRAPHADHGVVRTLLATLPTAPGLAGAASHDLAAVARLLPDLRTQFPFLPAASVDADVAPALSAVLAAVAEERPVALVVDDFPSADAPSRELLTRLAGMIGGRTLVVFSAPTATADTLDAAGRFARVAFAEQSFAVAHKPKPRSRAFIYGMGAAVAAGLAAVLLAALAPRWTRTVEDPRWVIVADVDNATGDSVFDRTVSAALTAALTQSPHLRVVAPDRISRAFVRMRRPETNLTLNEALAREVAQRDGVPFVVVPAVHAAGSAYELTTRILDATSGAVLAFAAERADDRAGVLDAIDRLGGQVRGTLGETARSIKANSVPLPLATTASLDALKKLAEGQRAFRTGRDDEAKKLWLEAVALDTSFAQAYASLGMFSFRENRPAEGDSLYARAFAHLAALTEREQVMIRAAAKSWRGDHVASAALLEPYLAGHPQDLGVLRTVAYEYYRMGQSSQAVALFERVLAIDSLDYPTWINLASTERSRHNLDAARRAYGRAYRLAPSQLTANDNVNLEYAGAFVLAGQLDSAAAVVAALAASPDAQRRARALRSQSFLHAFAGRYAEASSDLTAAIVLNREGKSPVSELRNRLLLADLLDEQDRPHDAVKQLDSAYALVEHLDAETTLLFWLGKALARSGDTRRSSLLLARAERIAHSESPTDRAAVEALRGEVLLAKGDSAGAVLHLERALADDSTSVLLESAAHGAATAGQFGRAAAIYTRMASRTEFGWEGQEPHRLASYWLARVHERDGRPAEARAAYEKFLTVWPQPDSALRSVMDARARLGQLRRREGGD